MRNTQAICFGACLVITFNSVQAGVEGYLKNLALQTDTIIGSEESVVYDLTRLRLEWNDEFGGWQFDLQYDIELAVGDYLQTQQYQTLEANSLDSFWDLEKVWHSNNRQEGRHSIYRVTVGKAIGPVDIRFGRQQLNWSRTFIWSTFDRFNPYDPLQIEPDERLGVDALQTIWNLNLDNTLEVVAVGERGDQGNAFGIRYRTHVINTDVDVMAADFGSVDAFGIAGAGQWSDMGWRFEITQNRKIDRPTFVGNRERYYDLVFSIDYTQTNEWQWIAEALYRGDGADNEAQYQWLDLLSGMRTDLAKHYVAIIARKGFDPIAGLEMSLLHNIDDSSSALIPTFNYSPGRFEDLHYRFGLQIFTGDNGSEFGTMNTLVFAEVQVFF